MNKKILPVLVILTLILLTWLGFVGGQYFYEQSRFSKGNIPDTPDAQQIMAVMERAYQILGQASRSFDTSEFPSVFIDTKDYKLTIQQREAVAKVLNVNLDDVKSTGYLTAMQAQYISMSQGAMGVPVSKAKIVLAFKTMRINRNKALVRYDDGAALQEAILVKVDGKWFIASIKPIWIHF